MAQDDGSAFPASGGSPGLLADLSGRERRLYERLLASSSIGIAELKGASAGLMDEDLAALQERGLVVRLPGDPPRVEARHPQEAFASALAAQREQARAAEAFVADLTARYAHTRRTSISLDLLEVISDPHEVLRHFHELERLAVREFRACDRPPYVSDPDSGDETMFERLASGVRYRVLRDPRSLGLRSTTNTRAWVEAGVQFRELSSVPLKLMIADDARALLVLDSRDGQIVSSLVVHPSALLQGLIAVFESLWQLAVPGEPLAHDPPAAGRGGARPSARASLNADDAELLSLLATGMTEAMIGRRLAVSSRTVQRRIQALMHQLGVSNRFQAGLWAARRGWL